jgi:cell division protein FtsB
VSGVRRTVWQVLAAMLVVVVLFVGVFPTRAWFAQRSSADAATEQLEVLRGESEVLRQRVEELRDEEEIERLAREQYNLVRPGEEAYAILPGPDSEPLIDDEVEPAEPDDRNVFQRAWDGVTGLF